MAINDAVGLLLKIRADGDQAKSEIASLRGAYDKELKTIQGGFKSFALSVGKDLGLTEQQMAKFGAALPVVGTALAATAGAAVGAGVAIFSLVKSTADAGSQIYDLSRATGLSAGSLSGLKVVAEQADSSIEEVAQGFARFTRTVGEADKGSKEAIATLKRFGLETGEAMLNADAALEKVLKRILELPPGMARAQAAQEVFGRSGAALVPVIEATGGSLDALKKKAQDLGQYFDDDAARQADEFGDQLDDLSKTATGLGNTFAREVVPEMTGAMRDLTVSFGENRSKAQEWGQGLSDVIRGVRSFFESGAVSVVSSIAQITGQLDALKAHPAYQFFLALRNLGASDRAEGARGFGGLPSSFSGNRFLTGQLGVLPNTGSAMQEPAPWMAVPSAAGRTRAGRGGGRGGGGANERQLEERQLALFNKELAAVTQTNREILAREYERGIKDIDEYVAQAKADNDEHYQNQLTAFERDEEIARKHIKNRRELQIKLGEIDLERRNALDAFNKENQRIDDEAQMKRQASELALNRQLAEIRESFRESERAKIDAAAEVGRISEESRQRQLWELLNQAFEDRKILLELELNQWDLTLEKKTEINNALIKLDVDRANAAEAASRRIIDAILAEGAVGPQGKITLPTEEEQRQRDKNLLPDAATNPDYGPPPDFSAHQKAIEEFKNFAVGAFSGITQGFGQMLYAFLMGGNAAGQSFGKMAKAVVAGLAAQALVESAMQFAHGLAALANPFTAWRAPLHFAAAKAFLLVGGVAAGIALAIPGGGASQGGSAFASASNNGNATSQDQRDRTRREARTGGSPDPLQPTIHVYLHAKTEPGTIVEHVRTAYDRGRHGLRDLIRQDVLGEATA